LKPYPLASIVIINHNGKELLADCLRSLRTLRYPNFEVIVVDSGSTDGTARMVERNFPEVRVVTTEMIGIGEADNIGIRAARGEVIVFSVNNDMVFDENWLTEQINVLMSSPDIGIVGGKRLYLDSDNIVESTGCRVNLFTGDPIIIGNRQKDSEKYDYPRTVDFFGCPCVKRDVIKKIGLCDPTYGMYYEDSDFCVRAKKVGFKVAYVPTSIMWHKGAWTVSKRQPTDFYYLTLRNKIRFIIKNFPLVFVFSALLYTLFYETLLNVIAIFPPSRSIFGHCERFRHGAKLAMRSAPGWTKAQWRAVFWNVKNIRSTLQARWLTENTK
jgi:hypothetical protein